jgi:hypothetical protein
MNQTRSLKAKFLTADNFLLYRRSVGPPAPVFSDGQKSFASISRGVEEASRLQTHDIACLLFRDDPLHFAEFIRLGEYDCFGTAIALH